MPGTRESVPSMRCSLIEAIWCICYRSIFLCFSLGTKVKFPRLFSDVSWIEGSQKLLIFHCSLKIKTIPSSLCTFCIFYRRKFCVYFWQKCFYFISLYSLIERKWFINCSIFENLLTANSEKRWVRSVFAAPTTTTTKIVATHIATRLHHSLHVIICHQMGIRLTNVAILRSTLPWLLEHVTSAITNPDLMEYDSCLSYCETGPSLDGISIGSTGNVKSFKNSMHRLVHFYAHIYLRWTHAAGFDSVYLKWRWWLRRYTPCTITLTQIL